MNEALAYDVDFYRTWMDGSARSASVIAPLVLDLLKPTSVVDVGCGIGTWLKAFTAAGVSDVVGLDGDWVERGALVIDAKTFQSVDLTQPFAVDRRFDLAVCLEVAEHVPASSAVGLVRSLAQLSPAVLFSAAIPGQGGTNHVNEQWPDYWARLFADCGYQAIDCIRPQVWDDASVEPWYAQNALMFVDGESADRLRLAGPFESGLPRRLVHPAIFTNVAEACATLHREPDVHAASLRALVDAFPHVASRFMKRRLGLQRPTD